MTQKLLILLTVFSMCCLVACGGEKKSDANAGGNNGEPVVTAAPIVEEPTAEPTVEPTAEPTPEPTADPVEELTSLRDEALAAHSSIVEQVQYRYDIASEILEVAKEYPNFDADYYYEVISTIKSDFEENLLTWNVESTVSSSNSLSIIISTIILECPELKTTEEFQKFVEAPALDIGSYDVAVTYYNSAVKHSSSTDFEELPHCLLTEYTIEY